MAKLVPARRLAALALALAALGGCKKDTVSIQATRLCSMPDDCTFSGECDAQFIDTPRLDVANAGDMWLAVEMRNNMPNNADVEAGRLNTHDAHFESYDLDYGGLTAAIDPSTITGLGAHGGRAQQFIPAEGIAVVGFEPFPVHVVDAIRAAGNIPVGPDYDEVLVTVTFKGRLEDGSEWEVPFDIPVQLCADCIPATCEDPTQIPLAACPSVYQYPRGALTCTQNPVNCLATGTFCGDNANVQNGDPNFSYACTVADSPPTGQTNCGAAGCDGATGNCN